MSALKNSLLCLSLIITACNSETSDKTKSENIPKSISIEKNETTKKYFIKFGEKIIGDLDAEYSNEPKLIATFNQSPPYKTVFLVQEFPQGNACDGGSVIFYGINHNEEGTKIGEAPNCGGPGPIVNAIQKKVTFPSHLANDGKTSIAKATFQIKNGVVEDISLPISTLFRKAIFGSGMVLQLKNNSKKVLSIVVRIQDPTTKEDKGFKMVIDGNGSIKELGHMEGWAFASGQKVNVENSEFEPIELEVP